MLADRWVLQRHTWNDLTDGCNLNQNTVGLVYEKKQGEI